MDASFNYIYCETRGNDILILPKNAQGGMPKVQNGIVVEFSNYPDEAINFLLVAPLNAKGYNLPSSGWLEEITTLNVGDSVPNWNKFQEF